MNPIISLSPSIISSFPLSNSSKMVFDYPRKGCSSGTRIVASRRSSEAHDKNYHNGKLVDENMIVLRKRIHEMKMVERNYEPPSEWFDWEKRYFTSYDSMICELMGSLQLQLMETRPSLALGMLALITLSVPTSMAMLFLHFVDVAKNLA
ncbi:hypothetical protein HS088_TW07G00795 [Tripterygium wilfordii]|uniref:Mediator of RNA polymerase II transcription subunit 18 n=1 Tax=Tripterygium wilfordii TaxID=458696 RepID=A0A7J7DFU9_TRIWF|nr:uncharacterized protein LOC120002311 [Tripterygium wilfordii]KAF5745212.1 hypothetical protein HS088_TW07G00795 [Tripterygium wilfordii]